MNYEKDVRSNIDPEIMAEARKFIEWVQSFNPDNAVALDEIMFMLEKEVYNQTVKFMKEKS
jgi:hypothetical protein